jgi:peptidoglycan L-alanyl-D-glutamate endopeptidase CwlK
MDKNSADRLEKVHPELKKRVSELLDNLSKKSLDVRVVQGLRTFAEQDALFAKRPKVTNARGGQSNHNYGLAVDLCPFKDGKPDWEDTKTFNVIGVEAKKLGLEWGGDWKRLVDKPHVQLPGLSIKDCFACYQKDGLKSVWARMNEILGGASPTIFEPTEDDLIESGDKGAEVKSLQQQLLELSLLRENEIDGIFGNTTKKAVIGFQRIAGLTADGIVGKGTKAKLKAILSS